MRIVNLEILGHPINILMIVGIIVLFWLAMFAVTNRGALSSLAINKEPAE